MPMTQTAKKNSKSRAPRNRTLTLSEREYNKYKRRLLLLDQKVTLASLLDRTICRDLFEILPLLPEKSVDLLFLDPPYNLTKNFNELKFSQRSLSQYEQWLETWLPSLTRTLKPTASVYICGDWRSSSALQNIAARLFIIRNRITWEREKGRGAKKNWKNASEDIWFCTVSNDYVFNLDAIKLKRKVLAPYTDATKNPKDWQQSTAGRFRLTHPPNLWTDLTVPFWSMPENTDHPTQKPEKLLARIILASSNPGSVVLDPFLGSGTTSVVARKLGRHYIGIERDETYCCLAEKRLEIARTDSSIQGYHNGLFWERNTLSEQKSEKL